MVGHLSVFVVSYARIMIAVSDRLGSRVGPTQQCADVIG